MTTIRASCPTCGDLKMKHKDVVVRVCLDNQRGSYRFRCPKCGLIVVKDADERIVFLLEETGVRREDWSLPRELWEERPGGPTITLDDVLDFHELLEQGLNIEGD